MSLVEGKPRITVGELRRLLEGMPHQAVVCIAFDPNIEHTEAPEGEYFAVPVARVLYDALDNTVELREMW